MVVIPGDRARIGRRTVTVAEAYLHHGRLVEITGTDGRVTWAPPGLVERLEPERVPTWRR
ncbi:hypothetical protein Athai_50250 [Actinocatenispora thailandica]|uniref:Integrase n=1 Tax=Actinocatenispora thailandica TaxID=227318 RepID=A0A7R7HYP3_9ACTN|nr:hypothetical protein [Actinocatenispora thailandica]BCJ37522.1 hypothetical protein Athai_50250 [Actinocatenispora thailandica]